MPRYFLEIAYNGTHYHGWQMQPDKKTVQSSIDKAISTIFNEPLHCTGCGRTDSGVHASQFFLHFEATKDIPDKFLFRLNKFLSSDIVVYRIFESDLHARYDATYRAYDYFLHFEKNPFTKEHSFFYHFLPLDVEKMKTAFASLHNYTDFKSFEKSKGSSKTSLCRIYKTNLQYDEEAQTMQIHIAANRFLRGMVRRVVGALLMVGKGKISLEEFKYSMDTQTLFKLNVSVPARGLFLSEVRYENYCGLYAVEDVE